MMQALCRIGIHTWEPTIFIGGGPGLCGEACERCDVVRPEGTCDDGNCDRRAVSFAYCERLSTLIPVCRRHICVYRVSNGLWQAEDEYADLQFARRSRRRWIAQWLILLDQRASASGREGRGQRRKRIERERTNHTGGSHDLRGVESAA